MAFFNRKKKKEEKKEIKVEAIETPVPLESEKKERNEKQNIVAASSKEQAKGSVSTRVSSVLLRPRITEKATIQAEDNVYVFEVSSRATKREVKEAMLYVYKVHPVKVNIVNMAPRKIFSRMRGTRGQKKGLKKAYVYLKKDDRIQIV